MVPGLLSNPVFRNYFSDHYSYDELFGEDGQLRPHWDSFFQSYSQLGDDEIISRHNDILRLLRENGVTYNIYGDPGGLNRPWKLDMIPYLVSQDEWSLIESGLLQRAELLNLILDDIYGERRLIKAGLLPMELVYNHAGFLRQCAGIRLPGKRQLILYSADLARSRNGSIWVVNDRTQAPSGSGYALENRTTMTRVLPEFFHDLKVRHLAPYFHALRNGLHDIAPGQQLNPRVVILTPGSNNETYFEHAYLSSYLGFTLVQGNDLIVKDNHVWLKTISGLERVDVILRRVDDVYCDPLELKEDSQLGIPGLLQAVRSGHVSIANPIGSGILENPGLMPFLQSAARYFLSADLLIPTIASWWCGQPRELQYVLEHIESLVIKKINRNPTGSSSIDGQSLSLQELAELKRRIRANPALYVGQEKVDISLTPAWNHGKIEPRKVLFRSFLVSGRNGYVAMPGGLCRTSTDTGKFLISNQLGGLSKDAWIISPEPGRVVNELKDVPGDSIASYHEVLPSHAAENLFWVGRYTERILGNARFLRTVIQFMAEGNKIITDNYLQTEQQLLMALTLYSYTHPGFIGEGSEQRFAEPWKELKDILFNDHRAGSLKYNFLRFQHAIHEVREHWSTDTWRVFRGIEEELQQDVSLTHHGYLQMLRTLDNLITSIVAFIGLNRETISREQGWTMIDIGRKIEHSLLLITTLRTMMVDRLGEQVEYHLLQSVLMNNEGLIHYRYKYRMPLQNSLVLDLMLFDPHNPRSLAYQVKRLKNYLKKLPEKNDGATPTDHERLVLEAEAKLASADGYVLTQTDENEPVYGRLDEFLSGMYAILSTLPDVISKAYFKHEMTPKTMIIR
ncbi:MAG TPA: circularly permuted type 2 ATP-grasp protein [Puia sp.]|nr:circularly permuted type 2 ATP-grasp protein [Puia sp.]